MYSTVLLCSSLLRAWAWICKFVNYLQPETASQIWNSKCLIFVSRTHALISTSHYKSGQWRPNASHSSSLPYVYIYSPPWPLHRSIFPYFPEDWVSHPKETMMAEQHVLKSQNPTFLGRENLDLISHLQNYLRYSWRPFVRMTFHTSIQV